MLTLMRCGVRCCALRRAGLGMGHWLCSEAAPRAVQATSPAYFGMAAASASSGAGSDAAAGHESSFHREQEAKAARRKVATDAAESFRSHESAAGSVFKVSGPREQRARGARTARRGVLVDVDGLRA